jgi:hypothetical protein
MQMHNASSRREQARQFLPANKRPLLALSRCTRLLLHETDAISACGKGRVRAE